MPLSSDPTSFWMPEDLGGRERHAAQDGVARRRPCGRARPRWNDEALVVLREARLRDERDRDAGVDVVADRDDLDVRVGLVDAVRLQDHRVRRASSPGRRRARPRPCRRSAGLNSGVLLRRSAAGAAPPAAEPITRMPGIFASKRSAIGVTFGSAAGSPGRDAASTRPPGATPRSPGATPARSRASPFAAAALSSRYFLTFARVSFQKRLGASSAARSPCRGPSSRVTMTSVGRIGRSSFFERLDQDALSGEAAVRDRSRSRA